jgi:hypothetical protein
MKELLQITKIPDTPQDPPDIEFFDSPMCCPTGLCGPTQDQTLLDVNEMILSLEGEGLRVERYQMASHPQVFRENAEVMKLVQEKQLEAMPITVIGDKVFKVGAYPSLAEIKKALDEASL